MQSGRRAPRRDRREVHRRRGDGRLRHPGRCTRTTRCARCGPRPRCASALAALNDELERDWGVTIAVRTGVNTGEVVAGDAAGRAAARHRRRGQRRRAARAGRGAGRDPARRADLPARPRRGRGRGGRAARAEGQGRAGPGATACSASHGRRPGRARRLDSPMVGRERELGAARQAFERAVAERTCHLFTVLGAAGRRQVAARRASSSTGVGRRRTRAARPLPALRRGHHLLAAGRGVRESPATATTRSPGDRGRRSRATRRRT